MGSRICATVTATAGAMLLGSCAQLGGFTPDPAATAPRLQGFGHSAIAITTRSDDARRLFNEGVLQAYAFNENEAVRMFKAALAQDPACAMCAWGVAWQLGPNINDPGRGRSADALRYIGHALRQAAAATPRERALLDAMALRYAHESTARDTAPLAAVCGAKREDGSEPPHPLDIAYAARMRALADAHPGDPDIASLYAEAELIATDADATWDKQGQPAGRVGEVTQRIERLLPAHLSHTGLNHYLIHLADHVTAAPRAVAAADRLAQLAPLSPHLVHMPSHIYVHMGRYDDATRANESAETAESVLADAQKAQGFEVSKDWRGHNRHFLWYAALMAGREDTALLAADRLTAQAEKWQGAFAEYVRSMRLIALVRLEQWDRVLAEPLPRGERGVALGWYEHARGVALARLGRVDEARAALGRLQAAVATVRTQHTADSRGHRFARALADVMEHGLKAHVAWAARDWTEALARQADAMQAAAKLDEREPPVLADGTRLVLGDIQLAAGRAAEAEASFRLALQEHPASGWALRGLARAQQAQGKAAEAAITRQRMERAWPQAAAPLRRV